MDLIITYDVDTTTKEGQRRLRKIAKTCEAYGQRVQFSVFEVVCREQEKIKLTAELANIINQDSDSIRIYRLPANALDDVEHLGLARDLNHRDPLII